MKYTKAIRQTFSYRKTYAGAQKIYSLRSLFFGMIIHLTGILIEKNIDHIVLNVHGVGYKVWASPDTITSLSDIGEEASVWTHLAVRENAMDLYGFLDTETLSFFELLIGVSGIGPKSALAILSLATTPTLRSAIASGDISYLTKVSGIGKKTAQKVVLELRDKIGAIESNIKSRNEDVDVVEALRSLGYSQEEAREVVKKIDAGIIGTSARVREALKQLGGE